MAYIYPNKVLINDNELLKEYLNNHNVKRIYYNGNEIFRRTAFSPYFEVDTTELEFSKSGGTSIIGVSASTTYSATTQQSWITLSAVSSGISVTVPDYSTGETERQGSVVISYDNGDFSATSSISITQKVEAELPDIHYLVNYNAKLYDPSTYTIPQTSGQAVERDLVLNAAAASYTSDHISVNGQSCDMYFDIQTDNLFTRDNATRRPITIVMKVKQGQDTSGAHAILSNRASDYNWMVFNPANGSPEGVVFLHTQTGNWDEVPNVDMTDTTIPNILSFTVDDNLVGTSYNYTTQTSGGTYNITWGGIFTNRMSFFVGAGGPGELWRGDFYWVYISDRCLTDEQIQQVIDYNEGL